MIHISCGVAELIEEKIAWLVRNEDSDFEDLHATVMEDRPLLMSLIHRSSHSSVRKSGTIVSAMCLHDPSTL